MAIIRIVNGIREEVREEDLPHLLSSTDLQCIEDMMHMRSYNSLQEIFHETHWDLLILSPEDLLGYRMNSGSSSPHFRVEGIDELQKSGVTHLFALGQPDEKIILSFSYAEPEAAKPIREDIVDALKFNGAQEVQDSDDSSGYYSIIG